MGSGCNTGTNFIPNCPTVMSDMCVVYTGEPIPLLGICTGDRISETIQVILDKLTGILDSDGGDIKLNNITANCDFVTKTLAGKDKNLSTMIQVLFDQNCTLHELITDLESKQDNPYAFDLKCICSTTPPTKPTKDQIIQHLIDKVCKLDETVTKLLNPDVVEDDGSSLRETIETVTGNFLKTHITSCSNDIVYKGAGKNTTLNFLYGCPVGTLLFGNYDLSWFDAQGRGLKSAGMCSWVLANGQNNSWDMRGFTPAGATEVPGGPVYLNTVIPGDLSTYTKKGDLKGNTKVWLDINNLPEHQHTVNQAPHSHQFTVREPADRLRRGTAMPESNVWQDHLNDITRNTASTTINISVGGVVGRTGAGERVDVRQPTIYGVWIQRVANVINVGDFVVPPAVPAPINGGSMPIQ